MVEFKTIPPVPMPFGENSPQGLFPQGLFDIGANENTDLKENNKNHNEEVSEVNHFSRDFISELREFMNDYAREDLGINLIEEPSRMTKNQANFYIKLYNQLELDELEMNKLCDEEIERVTKAVNIFREKRQKEIDSKKSYFMSLLKDFAMTELEGKKARTVKLPYGNLSFKKQQPKYNFGDEKELISKIKTINPELVKRDIVEKLDKTNLKKAGRIENGMFYLGDQLVENIIIEKQEDKFEVK